MIMHMLIIDCTQRISQKALRPPFCHRKIAIVPIAAFLGDRTGHHAFVTHNMAKELCEETYDVTRLEFTKNNQVKARTTTHGSEIHYATSPCRVVP